MIPPGVFGCSWSIHRPNKALFKCRNYINYPDEAEIQRLRHLPKHVTMATWLWGVQSSFCQGWCQFIFLSPWLVIAFLSLSSVPLWTVYSLDTHTAGESRERPNRQISVTDSKTRAFCYPRLLLRIPKLQSSQWRFVLSHRFLIQKTFTECPLCNRYCAERCN